MLERLKRFWDHITLANKVVALHKAERELRNLSFVTKWVAGAALLVSWIAAWQYPLARARAQRILLDRHATMAGVGLAAYTKGVQEVTDLIIRTYRRPDLSEDEKYQSYQDLTAVRTQFLTNAEAMKGLLQWSVLARNSVPTRIWWSTPWIDPLTGMAFQDNASKDDIANVLVSRRLQGKAWKQYIQLAEMVSSPGAPALPSVKTVLEKH